MTKSMIYFSARLCGFVDSNFAEVRRARLCEIVAAPIGMIVSTKPTRATPFSRLELGGSKDGFVLVSS